MKIAFGMWLVGLAAVVVVLGSLAFSCSGIKPYNFYGGREYASAMENFADYGSSTSLNDSKSSSVEGYKLPGFDGLYESPAVDKPIDVFSADKGDVACVRTGYSNQDGFLCLSPAQIKLLETRGGNS